MDNFFTPVQDQEEAFKVLKQKFGDGDNFDVDKLAKGKLESDQFIQRLQSELEELRGEVKTKTAMDEILTKLREQATITNQPPVNQNQGEPKVVDNSTIEQMVEQQLSKRDSERRLEENKKLVQDRLEKVWGADAQLNLTKKAREIGVSLGDLSSIALSNPNLFFATVGLTTGSVIQAQQVAPKNSQMTPLDQSTGSVRNKAYYDKLKQTDKVKYFSKEVRKQMMKDALGLGDKWDS